MDTAIATTSATPLSALEASRSALEDSDAWLLVAPDELDGMMMRASGRDASAVSGEEGGNKPAELGEEHGQALQDLAKKVEQFVGGQGDVEGARFAE